MQPQEGSSPAHTSIVTTDWGARDIPGYDPRYGLYELEMLSLFYDEILIPDEILALSERLPRWFSGERAFGRLDSLLQTGALVVLTHPLSQYRDGAGRLDEELVELAAPSVSNKPSRPILARAKYIERYSTYKGEPFRPSAEQCRLYDLLDRSFASGVLNRRPVVQSWDIMDRFRDLFIDILKNDRYPWDRSFYNYVTPKMRSEFVSYASDTSRAWNLLLDHDRRSQGSSPSGLPTRKVRTKNGIPVFDRSFAFQLTDMYPRDSQAHMRKLIQAVFVVPFCQREHALGKYNRFFRELPIVEAADHQFSKGQGETTSNRIQGAQAVCKPEVVVDLKGSIPEPMSDFERFGGVLAQIRGSDAGRELRCLVRQLNAVHIKDELLTQQVLRPEDEITHSGHKIIRSEDEIIGDLRYCWAEVARDMATQLGERAKPIGLRTIIGTVAGSVFVALLGYGMFHRKMPDSVEGFLGPELGSLSISIGGQYVLRALNQSVYDIRLRRTLEQVVAIRCSDPQVPMLSAPDH